MENWKEILRGFLSRHPGIRRRGWGKLWQISVEITESRTKFLPIQVRRFNAWPTFALKWTKHYAQLLLLIWNFHGLPQYFIRKAAIWAVITYWSDCCWTTGVGFSEGGKVSLFVFHLIYDNLQIWYRRLFTGI